MIAQLSGDYMISQYLTGAGGPESHQKHLSAASGQSLDTTVRGRAQGQSKKESEACPQDDATDRTALVRQCLKYAEDLAKVYEEEKHKRKALEVANQELGREILARIRAETELRQGQLMLEDRVQERTQALALANQELQREIERRQHVEEQLKASLEEKEILLSEVHHRVKNNLQIVSSLLGLQRTIIRDERIVSALVDSQNRIRSMALIHEQLYRSQNLGAIKISDYVRGLVAELLRANSTIAPSVSTKIHVDDVMLPVGMALSCGLILNELVTNCLKHAFVRGQPGEIRIDFQKESDKVFVIVVSDNGIGLPPGFNYRNSGSLGLQLVLNLAEVQLRGSAEVRSGPGTTFEIRVRQRESL